MREIEQQFGDEVAGVGVHSGKFIDERVTRNIARACERLGVSHPVLKDWQFRTWREYAVRAWPTLVIVSPDGYYADAHAGEISAAELSPRIERVLAEARSKGSLRASEPRAGGHAEDAGEIKPLPGVLRFPAKLATAPDERLWIADTGHQRVVEIALGAEASSGQVCRVIGTGEPGWQDGDADEARFRSPHGLAFAGETLRVADTENHRIRSVDLGSGRVSTIAGTGEQARPRSAGGDALRVRLNSPWDLLWTNNGLYVAMAGSHQLWRVHPERGIAEVFAGSGAEELYDAPLEQAALAQPSGLATDGSCVFFADAVASAIRWARDGDRTGTIVGTGLFDFGDRDGTGDEVRLQHSLGLAWWPDAGGLLVADTYNHRIRRVLPATRQARTLAGTGEPGFTDGAAGEAQFWEPGGIAISGDGSRAFVADTNNHALRVIDLATGRVTTVELRL